MFITWLKQRIVGFSVSNRLFSRRLLITPVCIPKIKLVYLHFQRLQLFNQSTYTCKLFFTLLGSDYNPYGDYGFVPTPSDLTTDNITHTTCSVSWYMSEADAVGVDKYEFTYTDGIEEKNIYVPGK